MSKGQYVLYGEPVEAYLNPPAPPTITTCANHAPKPNGYNARHDWFRLMDKTHKQERCGECGLWSIWRPRAGTGE